MANSNNANDIDLVDQNNSINLISDAIRNYFSMPWFDLSNQNNELIRKYLANDKSRHQALLVQLMQNVPILELVSLEELKRRKKLTQLTNSPHGSILFLQLIPGGNIYSKSNKKQNLNDLSDGSFVQIRAVTDDEAIKHLSDLLQNCTQEQILPTYQQLERFIDREKVIQNLSKERKEFLRKLTEWSESLLEYSVNNENVDDEDNYDNTDQQTRQISRALNEMADKILAFKQRQKTIDNILANILFLFRDVAELSSYRATLEETSQLLASESNHLFNKWVSGVSRDIRVDLTKQCIIINEDTNIPCITFNSQLEKFAQQSRQLEQLDFQISEDIKKMEQHVSLYVDFVRDLRTVVQFYLTVAEQILLCQRPMLIDKAKAFTSLLESKQKLTWSDGAASIAAWINELKQCMEQFKKENSTLQRLHYRILELIKRMFDISLFQWKGFIDKIKLIMSEVRNQNYSNTFTWCKHWDYQLYKILEYYFYRIIKFQEKQPKRLTNQIGGKMLAENSEQSHPILAEHEIENQWQRMNEMIENEVIDSGHNNNIELQFNPAGQVTFEPSFELLKQIIFERFKRFIRFPSSLVAFVDWSQDVQLNPADKQMGTSTKTLFHNIYYRNAKYFGAIYNEAFKAIDELIEIRQRFIKWTGIYYLIKSIKFTDYKQNESSEENFASIFACQTLDNYQYNLKLIKELAEKFSKEYSMINEIYCQHSNFIVNIIHIKMFIEWLFSEAETVLLQKFREQCFKEISKFESIARENIELLKHEPTCIKELIEFDQLNKEKLENIYSKLTVDNVTLREKIHFLKNWPSSLLLNNTESLDMDFEKAKTVYNEFENIYQNKNELLDNYGVSLKCKVTSELELINCKIDDFMQRWIELSATIKQTPEVINDFQINCNQLMDNVNELSASCKYFDLKIPKSFESIVQVNEEIMKLYGQFHVVYEFDQGLKVYLEMEWIVCRNKLGKIFQYIENWTENHFADDPFLGSHIEQWRQFLANIELCRGDSYQAFHWKKLLDILEIDEKSYENLILNDFWLNQNKIPQNRAEILLLNQRAFNDKLLHEALNDLNQFSTNEKFILYPYYAKNNKEVMLIKDWQQCHNKLSDCFLLIQTVRNSTEISDEYIRQYQDWENKLMRFESLIQLLNSVQRKWISLEPIYQSAEQNSISTGPNFFNDITFVRYSNDFQDIMRQIKQNDGKFSYLLAVDDNWETRLQVIDQNFSATQKKLRTFIEECRQRFPRFYFLADEDLLLILSGKVDLNQSALIKKLFINTIGWLIYRSADQITDSSLSTNKTIEAIESIQGEIIYLQNPIFIDNTHGPSQIENWLRELDTEIKSTLKFIFNKHLNQKSSIFTDLELFVFLPSQLICLYCYLDFTEKVEKSIENNSLNNLRKNYDQILKLFTEESSDLSEKLLKILIKERNRMKNVNGRLGERRDDYLCKIKIKQIVLDVIHFITTIDSLLLAKVEDKNHWCWKSQLRFYLIRSGQNESNVQIQIGLTAFDYSFEYLGCLGDSKLVYTELTNKCFLTLTQAMDLGLGGNPYGPAGTGKTESVKALGQYFGRQVLVFNCDEAIDARSMTRILVGLLKCGSFGCFDEFNRLQLDVLSVLSSQIQEIQNCIKNKQKAVKLDEYGLVSINNDAAIFITLNPAGKNYGGRNRIPDNLKSLFLPVSMTLPEISTIVQFLSLAEGFSQKATKIFGNKIPCWFEFAAGSMSYQRHYDWGLRTIKACLESSGRKLSEYRSEVNQNGLKHEIDVKLEIDLFINTLRQQIKSKLIDLDASKFEGLIEAVFGPKNVSIVNTNANDELIEAIEKSFLENGFVQNEYQMEKILQLNEQIQSRFGVVLIGPSGSGKSTILQILRKALSLSSSKNSNQLGVKELIIIDPKSMQRSKMFGYIDEDTREWHDGIFSSKARDITRNDSTGIGMYWIVFDGDIDPDWVEALNSVLDDNRVLTLPSGERIDFDLKKCRILFETTSLRHASPATISRLGVVSIDRIMNKEMVHSYIAKHQLSFTAITTIENYLDANYHQIYSIISTTRALLEHIHYCHSNNEDELIAIDRISGKLADNSNGKVEMINDLVLTKSVRRYVEMIKPIIDKHICLIGPISAGKSALANELVFARLANGFILTYECTPTSDAATFLKALFGSSTLVHNGSNKTLRTQTGQPLLLFIKHLELLITDKWGSNSLVSLLVQLAKYQGFYHLDSFDWITLDPTFQIIITCTDVHLIDKRLQTQLHLIQLNPYELNEIEQILEEKTKQINPAVRAYFPKQYFELIHQFNLVPNISTKNETEKQNGQGEELNLLKIGLNILNILKRYEVVDEHIVQYEIIRMLTNNVEPTQRSCLKEHVYYYESENNIYTSITGLSKHFPLSLQQFRQQITKWINNYCQENDIHQPLWPVLPQTMSLVADLCSFLAYSTDDNQVLGNSIPVLMIIGPNGIGKRFLTRTIAHNFGYDKIWSPESILSERHLHNELNSLFITDTETPSNTDREAIELENQSEVSGRKLLILVDEIHLEIFPSLRDELYSRINNFSLTKDNFIIRVIITGTEIKPLDHLMWLRRANIHYLSPFNENDYKSLAKTLIEAQVSKLSNIDLMCELFYKIYIHFQKAMGLITILDNIRFYTNFVQTFIQIYDLRLKTFDMENERMKKGVVKLDQVSNQVQTLKNEAYKQKQLLDSKRAEADEAFNLIMNSMHQSENKKIELEDVQQQIKVESQNLKERKVKIDEELNEIEPVLSAAKAAISAIRSDALTEIRSLRAPPEVIRNILEGVLRLMGVNDTSWVSMKTFLSRRGIKDEIINFDCHKVTPEMRMKVEQLLEKKSDSFNTATAKRASAAAAPLAEWVRATVEYSRVLHKIEPLEMELKKLEFNLLKAQSKIKTLDNQMQDVDTEVDSLREKMQAVTVEAAQIEINLNKSTETLERSESIVNNLSAEHQRWNGKLNQIELELERLPFKSLISAAYITFCSQDSNVARRKETLQECFEQYNIDPFDLSEFLNFDSEEEFVLFGAKQAASIESTNLKSFQAQMMIPLVYDPGHKSLNYFSNVELTKFSAKDWFKLLELSVRFGRTMIITDFNQFNARLLPLIMGNVYGSSNSRFWTTIGDKKIDYNPNFSLYLMTDNLENISSLTLSLLRVVNLSPSFSSISSKLLELIIKIKRPELEEEKNKIEQRVKNLQLKLKELEDELLEKLSNETGNILDNAPLIEKLKYLKNSADQVKKSLEESDQLKSNVNEQRMLFKELSTFAAQLFFSVKKLPKLCRMYYFGYVEFEQLFVLTLKQKSDSMSEFSENDFYQAFYRYITRALFTEHRKAFHSFVEIHYSNNTNFMLSKVLGNAENFFSQTIDEFVDEMLSDNINKNGIYLIVTTPGSDPTTEIKSTIQRLGSELQIISMGRDVIQQVSSLIQQSSRQITAGKSLSKDNSILCLNNLHLVPGWLTQLTQLLSNKQPSNKPLLLISECCDEFPITLLEMCIKFAYESAPGLRAHLRRLHSQNNDQSKINLSNNASTEYLNKICISLEYFHSICCERRFYIPFGWLKNYEFGYNEFHFGCNILQKLLHLDSKLVKNSGKLYQYISGLFQVVIYGGKIDFLPDETVLAILLKRCFHPESDFLLNIEQQQLRNSDLTILGLPLNSNKFREQAMEKRLKQNIQLISSSPIVIGEITKMEEENNFKTKMLNPSGILYFRKIWSKVLAKCKIVRIEYLKEEVAEGNITEANFLEADTLSAFIHQFNLFELDFAKRLILQINYELNSLPTINNVEQCLKINQTPDSWLNVWLNGTETAQDFLINLARIYMKLSKPLADSIVDKEPKLIYNIANCFHPRLFLNSLKQFSARHLSISVDNLNIEHKWINGHDRSRTNEMLENRIEIQLDGILIDGAQFQNGQLTKCLSDSPFTSAIAPVTIIFSKQILTNEETVVELEETTKRFSKLLNVSLDGKGYVPIPLYSSPNRQTLLDHWSLPCAIKTEQQWLEMSVALVLGNES